MRDGIQVRIVRVPAVEGQEHDEVGEGPSDVADVYVVQAIREPSRTEAVKLWWSAHAEAAAAGVARLAEVTAA